MKRLLRMILVWGMLMGGITLFALENPLEPKNWGKQHSCSGSNLKMAQEENEHAVRFIASFADTVKDRWLYPSISLTPEDRNCNILTFEIRAVQNPAGIGYKNCLVIFLDKNGKALGSLEIPAPGEEYSKVTLGLGKKLKFQLSDVAKIRIGVNNRDAQEVALFIRNLRFEKALTDTQ